LTQQLTSSPRGKLLDEGSFQELLAAAFVLQQHHEHASKAAVDPAELLSEIIRLRRSIRTGKLDLVETARLISEQVQKYTHADGVAIGIVTDDELIYLAAIGMAAHDIGRRVPRDSSFSAQCIRTRLPLQSPRAQEASSLSDPSDVKSFIAVPVDYENKVVGALEARFRTANAFSDDDVRTCELMAVLVKEVIAQAGHAHAVTPALGNAGEQLLTPSSEVEPEVKSEVKSRVKLYRRSELVTSEELAVSSEAEAPRPTDKKRESPIIAPAPLMQLFNPPRILPVAETHETAIVPAVVSALNSGVEKAKLEDTQVCRGCGQPLAEDELFCGKCGTEKIINPDGPLQSKWASLWFMNEARRIAEKPDEASLLPNEDEDEPSIWKPQALPELEVLNIEKVAHRILKATDSAIERHNEAIATQSASPLVRLEWLPDTAASSKAEGWLRHHWRVNRANFYLAGASLLLIAALSTPALDAGSPSGTQLSLFDRMLIGLGIAEAPDAPVYRGNPDTPVWVDLHTALYYCPGSDLYGKTDGGKIATQRSAQMDQFEPAHRKACN
jgi:hypothetical protein